MPEAIITSAFPPIVLGALRAALDRVSALALANVPFAASSTLKSRSLAQHDYAKCVANYRSLRAYLHSESSSAFEQSVAGRAFSLVQKADLFLATTHVLQTTLDTAHLIARIAGTSAIDRDNAMARALCDIQVIAQHAFGADSRYTSVGQVYWDEALDFPLMEMD